jgi:prephenate dehydrogenase
MKRITIVGTGLIGASIGLALKASGFAGTILGWDANATELATAQQLGAIDEALPSREAVLAAQADVTVLATPVMAILDWMERLAPVPGEGRLVTDVGSTKREIAHLAEKLFNAPGRATFLPGHPMAGKESGGASLADATLFHNATWIFTPISTAAATSAQNNAVQAWYGTVSSFGAQVRELTPERHDEICAWVSHLPQMVSTALAALLADEFPAAAPEPGSPHAAEIEGVGGRALREMTRLGASPYSMWRDVALTNTEPIAQALAALEQRLAHLRENLRTPDLREEIKTANHFRDRSR